VIFLRITGQDEKADRFAEKLCGYTQSVMEDPFSRVHVRNFMVLNCHNVSNNKEEFIKTLENILFEKEDLVDWFIDIKIGLYLLFENDPEFKQLFKRIEAEVHRQRAGAVAVDRGKVLGSKGVKT
jgi:hypothetical protein